MRLTFAAERVILKKTKHRGAFAAEIDELSSGPFEPEPDNAGVGSVNNIFTFYVLILSDNGRFVFYKTKGES